MGCAHAREALRPKGNGVKGDGPVAEDQTRLDSRSEDPFEFERFAVSVDHSCLPLVAFSDDVGEMRVWRGGSIATGVVRRPQRLPDLRVCEPVAMSPAYLDFVLEPYMPRVLQYHRVAILFERPRGAVFMQPSIDTVLVCRALHGLFASAGGFRSVVDIGAGSGFIGKFAAAHAPGQGELQVTLVDVDPAALQYSRSAGFAATACGVGGRRVAWSRFEGDAMNLLRQGAEFDLLASNPPYVPTLKEVTAAGPPKRSGAAGKTAFWEGTGLVVALIGHFASRRCAAGAHLVLAVSSLTLKAPGVVQALEQAEESGVQCTCLLEREVAWKAWYAGPWGHNYLLASGQERWQRQRVGALELFVGAVPPGEARLQTVQDGRSRCWSLHWHVLYVLDFSYV